MSSRRTGRRYENLAAEALEGERISEAGLPGADVRDKNGRFWEIKYRKKGAFPKSILDFLDQAEKEGAHAVLAKTSRRQWIVIMDFDNFKELYYD